MKTVASHLSEVHQRDSTNKPVFQVTSRAAPCWLLKKVQGKRAGVLACVLIFYTVQGPKCIFVTLMCT